MTQKLLICVLGLLVFTIIFVAIQLIIIAYSGTPVPAPTISREPQRLGDGHRRTFVIMGDSTTIAQGARYDDGYAVAAARYLANTYDVTWYNVGVSGARAHDVATEQLPQAIRHKPDIVLIAVGANDVTHFTRGGKVRVAMEKTVRELRAANPDVRIVVTGSPAMNAVDRFPWAAQRFAGWRVKVVNQVFHELTMQYDLTFAPIAEKTGPAFAADPTLFAQDKFHPNSRGYALWIPVINQALDKALRHESPS